jgi:hypothetical protein
LGGRARAALFPIIVACNDSDEANRFLALQLVQDLCREGAKGSPDLFKALDSSDEKVRLEAIRMMVRILPEVHAARGKSRPGWRLLREIIWPEGLAREEPMAKPRRTESEDNPEPKPSGRKPSSGSGHGANGAGWNWTLDEPSFLESLPTAVRNLEDPVVRAMREKPGHWFVWNEATREILVITDNFKVALDHIADPDDPDVHLEMSPGIHPDAPIHRPLKLLPWESPNVIDDVHLLWGDTADAWLDCPNPHFEGRKPRELVGTRDELFLRELLRGVRYGATS